MEDSAVRAEMAADVGVKVEWTGLACCPGAGGPPPPSEDEVNDEEDPDRPDAISSSVVPGAHSPRVVLGAPEF